IIGRVVLPASPVKGMGAWPNAEVGDAHPVIGIVDSKGARFSKVGNLILDVAGLTQLFLHPFKLLGNEVLRSGGKLPLFNPLSQGGIWFDGQGIAADMPRVKRNGSGQILLP